MNWCLETRYLKDMDPNRRGADGVWVENLPRSHYIGIEIQKMMTESKCEQNEETKKIVLRMLSVLLSMLEDSREDIGRFQGLDPRRNGPEPMSTNRMENERELLKE